MSEEDAVVPEAVEASEVEVPEVEEAPEVEAAEVDSEPAEQITEEAANSEDEAKKSKGKGAQARIAELVRQREEARQEAESLRQQMQAPTPPAPSGPPQEDQFSSYDDFIVAKAEYNIEQKQRVSAEQSAAMQRQQHETQEQHRLRVNYQTQVELARDKYDDFDDVVNNPDLAVTPDMARAIAESDKAGDLAYALCKNPAEAQRIAGLSPHAAIRELGRLEATLTPPPKSVSKAPAPPSTVDKRSAVPRDREHMSMDDYRRSRGFNPI
jgi:hypothetical protein